MPSASRNKSKKPRRRSGSPINQTFLVGRFGIIFAITMVLAVAIGCNLIKTTWIHADAWNAMGDSTLMRTRDIRPVRGEILASDGSILATNLYYYNVMLDMRANGFKIVEFVDTLPMICDSLAKYFPSRTAEQWREKFDKVLAKPKSERTRNFVLGKNVPDVMLSQIKKWPFFRKFRKATASGLKAEAVMKRSYPFGNMAELSIGRVSQMAEDPEIRGRSGLEAALDSLLYGRTGRQRITTSNRGTRYVEEIPAINGYDVTTTIDITMQDILEGELGRMLIDAKADWGSAILMEVATGDIKAISNLERDTLSKTPRYIEGMNRAVLGFEPGSVMKVMTMAVALEKGFAKPITKELPIGHSFAYLGRRPIRDTHSPGSLPVSRFLEYSSNIGMVKLTMPHYEGNLSQFHKDLADLGFFDRFNTGMARERRPYFPKVRNDVGGKLDMSRQVFGYCTMIPPLYTCAFYNAVANDGKFVRPRLVKGLRSPEGHDSVIPVSYVRERMMTPENAAILRKMMRDVVWEQGGTAKALRNDAVTIAGKTGTCKIALEDKRPRFDKDGNKLKLTPFKGGYLEGHYRVTFCGFFPYENPKYTCIVVINDPKLPYRGPAVSSGTVLKNVALKLFARGMLFDDPVLADTPEADKADAVPTIYSSFDTQRVNDVNREIRAVRAKAIQKPRTDIPRDSVPDVRGVSLREALTRLESAGYAVAFDGVGYVYEQHPAPGSKASPGSKIRLSLRYN